MRKRTQSDIWSTYALTVLTILSSSTYARPTTKQQAGKILQQCNIKGGLIVQVGCGNGRLTAALGADERYLVHGLERDAAKVTEARRYIRELGLYGRVSVTTWSGTHLPYAENLVNLLVAEEALPVSTEEVMRVLAPRGVAYVKQHGKWSKTVKPWPKEIDEWTHWLHDASGNAVARDQVVGPPRTLQWAAKPLWQRHHDTVPSTTAMVSANGRLFYTSDEAPAGLDGSVPDKWFLVARDAFNGTLLWKRAIAEWGWSQWSADWKGRFNEPPHLPKRLVAAGNRVYVTLNFNAPLTALDAATGKILRVYKGTENTDEILNKDGLLVLSLNHKAQRPEIEKLPPVNKSVCVLKADTGEMLWKKWSFSGLRGKFNSAEPFGRLELALGGGQIFLVDHDAIISLDLTSGEQRWKIARPEIAEHLVMYGIRMSDMCVLLYQDGVVLFAQPQMVKKRSWHTLPGTLYAYRAEDGELLWKHRYGGWSHNWQPDVFVIDGLVWVHEHQDVKMKGHDIPDKDAVDYAVIGLDLTTGEIKRRFSTKETCNVGHHHRCYRGKATERCLLASRRGVEFIDLASGENDLNHWARGACLHGIVPCNGLLYLTPHPCDCYIETKLNGYFALAPKSSSKNRRAETSKGQVESQLEKGPAYGQIAVRQSKIGNPYDWPTFRRDPLRSGSTTTVVPADIGISWRAAVGGRLRPPVIANDKLFVASSDRHQVAAFDVVDGKAIWNFTAGGRVDTPPTIYKGLVLFGSADGWVYCLRAADGQLAWRRRAAPRQRLVGAFGQLESAWPVHGSILAMDDVIYLAAGRSSYLDGGIYFYSLDPVTGKVLSEKTLYSPDSETDKMPAGDARTLPGVLADILVSDGSSIFMRQEKVLDRSTKDENHLLVTAGFRDNSWFNRTRWAVGAVTHAQLLVFDEHTAYGIQAYPGTARWGFFNPGNKGYLLFAGQLKAQPIHDKKLKRLWERRVPVRVTAMVLAKGVLFVAGSADVVPDDDPYAAFEGRKGAKLWAVSAADGSKLAEYELKYEPVYDGMAAAGGKLYIAAANGEVLCLD